jgi:hypothetical protein
MKTELEEVAKNFIPKSNKWTIKDIFIDGAKWQQEQDKNKYSEEEVLVLLHKRDKHNIDNPNTFKGWKTPKEWFEQHKKK